MLKGTIMLYKPNFCCNCGEAVERFDWKPWTSTRFCENCESSFRLVDWFPRIGLGMAFLLGLFGFGSYLKPSDKPINVANNQFAVVTSNKTQTDKNSNISKLANQTNVSNSNLQNSPINQVKEIPTPATKPIIKETPQNMSEETVYFCGAQTKKGTPCTRKVKGWGRCWQHAGQPAMLPKEKLVASQ